MNYSKILPMVMPYLPPFKRLEYFLSHFFCSYPRIHGAQLVAPCKGVRFLQYQATVSLDCKDDNTCIAFVTISSPYGC